ncbi:MAG: exodeoxyribonuclease VII small subunit, partial [Anaerolineae bacterium]
EVKELSFEEAFRELEETVQKLEEGNLTLDESIALFERGTQLAARCGKLLDQAELKVRQLVPSPEGEYELAEFEPEEGEEPF